MLKIEHQRAERQCCAMMMFRRGKTQVRVCYWRRLRSRYAPRLPHHKNVWRRVVNAPHVRKFA